MENISIKNLLQSLSESFIHNVAVKKVYGEPITAQGKTIITVAKVSQGFGGGFGGGYGGKKGTSNTPADGTPAAGEGGGEGGGIGGGMSVSPIGVIEITDKQTKFIRFDTSKYLVIGAVVVLAASFLWNSGKTLAPAKKLEKEKMKDKKEKNKKKKKG